MSQPEGEVATPLALQPVELVVDGIHLALIMCWVYLALCVAGLFAEAPFIRPVIELVQEPHRIFFYVLTVVTILDYPYLVLFLKQTAKQAQQGGNQLAKRITIRASFAAMPIVYFVVFYLIARG